MADLPLLGFVARSGTGKTTLLERLIPRLAARGVRCALIKHSHHSVDLDTPGKDSYRLRAAGARQVLLASCRRWALLTETPDQPEPTLDTLVAQLDPALCDLVLVEGFKHHPFPKVELHRAALGHPLLYPDDTQVIALASDAPPPPGLHLPYLDLNDPVAIAEFILHWLAPGGDCPNSVHSDPNPVPPRDPR